MNDRRSPCLPASIAARSINGGLITGSAGLAISNETNDMSMSDLAFAISVINDNKGQCFFAGARPTSLIEAAEKALDLTFPQTYRRFLREFGCGSIGHEEIYGIIHADFHRSSVPDAVWTTMQQRILSSISKRLVITMSLGDGDFAAILCTDGNDEGAIVRYSPGSDNEFEEEMASDFGEFILGIVRSTL